MVIVKFPSTMPPEVPVAANVAVVVKEEVKQARNH